MGQNDFNFGVLVAFLWLATAAAWIFAGVIAWEWVDPDSFFGAIGFLIVWGILTKIAHMAVSAEYSL